jgi:sugar (pentulose or hexulose) kinase
LGAAIDAAVGLRLYPDFKTAIKEMTHTGKVFEPITANRNIYEGLYQKVYLKLYQRLQPLYKQIREITNYPGKT